MIDGQLRKKQQEGKTLTVNYIAIAKRRKVLPKQYVYVFVTMRREINEPVNHARVFNVFSVFTAKSQAFFLLGFPSATYFHISIRNCPSSSSSSSLQMF